MAVPPPFPATHDIAGDKAALRAPMRAARSAFVASLAGDEMDAATRAIAARLAGVLAGDGAIGGYVAHRGEPDVLPALREAHRAGRAIALPRVDRGGMCFVGWHPDTTLAPGFGGIAEPADGHRVVPATLLVPLLGFDRAGGRLGQGAGCYDRWLARHPGTRTIGVGWSVQEAPAIPREPWDMPMDLIVTEAEVVTP